MKNKKVILRVINVIFIILILVIIAKSFIGKRNIEQETYIINENGERCDAVTIESFNSKFDIYAGVINGSNIKQLVNTINANNMSNPSNIVTISGEYITQLDNKNNCPQYKFNGGNAKKYKVQIVKTYGITKNINIYDNETNVTEYEIETFKDNNKEEQKENKLYIDYDNGIATLIVLFPIILLYAIILIYCKLKKKKEQRIEFATIFVIIINVIAIISMFAIMIGLSIDMLYSFNNGGLTYSKTIFLPEKFVIAFTEYLPIILTYIITSIYYYKSKKSKNEIELLCKKVRIIFLIIALITLIVWNPLIMFISVFSNLI